MQVCYNYNMKKRPESVCPIVYSLDIWGDPWSLVILREILILHKRHYREFMTMREGISTNILASKLESLVKAGILEKKQEGKSKKDIVYIPTQKGIELTPVITAIMSWGLRYNPKTDLSIPIMKCVWDNPDEATKKILHDLDVEEK